MLKNYFTIAWRRMLNKKGFSLINIAGLAIGTAVFVLIMEFVAFEWGSNRFHKNYDHLYRASVFHGEGQADYHLAPGAGLMIQQNLPAVADVVRIVEGLGSGTVTLPNRLATHTTVNTFRENAVTYVDGNFFKVFTFPVVAGRADLHQPFTMAISQSTAHKYFGNTNAIGQVLQVNNQFGNTAYTVTAVYQDMPQQSDIKADLLLSYSTLNNPAQRNGNDWADPKGMDSGYSFIYLLLKPNVSADAVTAQLTALIHRLMPQHPEEKAGLQPMRNLHLAPGFTYNYPTTGSFTLVFSFVVIASLILVIAWVNYTNLTTAQLLSRAKEVGMRKILGAGKWQVMGLQFTETGLLLTISTSIALLLVWALQPLYNSFTGKPLSLNLLFSGWMWLGCLVLVWLGTFAAGSYLAWFLSSITPVKALRSKADAKAGGIPLRQGLMVFQFTVSVLFIIATITLYRQLHFMQTQQLGFNPSQLVSITGPAIINSGHKQTSQQFENELSNLPYVEKYAASNNIPGQGYDFSANGITRLNPKPGDEKNAYHMLIVDDHYLNAYQIKMAQGTGFSAAAVQRGWSAAKQVLINEAATAQLGFKTGENIAGQKIKWGGDFEVIGVVKNYHHLSLHTAIEPMIFLPSVADGYFTVKITGGNIYSKMQHIRQMYQKLFPGEPFEYVFIDNLFNQQYQNEQRMGKLFMSSALVAILIACLGLLGMASYVAQQRTKEIGVRKVLGATVTRITLMLSADFLKPVAIGILIASPLAWYLMQGWLQNFAYRIDIQWWVFASAALITTGIALLTIGARSVKAALINPVKSLRSE